MKYSALLLIPFLFVLGCADDIKELSRVTREFALTQSADADLPEGPVKTFTASQTFDATADVQAFSSNLDAVTVKSITMEFSNYSTTGTEDVTITEANLEFEGTG